MSVARRRTLVFRFGEDLVERIEDRKPAPVLTDNGLDHETRADLDPRNGAPAGEDDDDRPRVVAEAEFERPDTRHRLHPNGLHASAKPNLLAILRSGYGRKSRRQIEVIGCFVMAT